MTQATTRERQFAQKTDKGLRVTLHEYQARAYRSTRKIVALIAGTGGGKTTFGSLWVLREVVSRPGATVLAVSPTFMMLSRVMLPTVRSLLDEVVGGEYSTINKTYSCRNGSALLFGSAVDPYSLEGTHLDAVWLDEAGQMKREVFFVARRRVAVREGRILITTTPYELNWLKEDVYDRWLAGDDEIDVISFPSTANPAYPREEFEAARRALPDWLFRMFYLGEFARPVGAVFPNFSDELIVDDASSFGTPNDVIVGLDWGFANPTAMVVVARFRDGRLLVTEEVYERGLSVSDVVARAKDIAGRHRVAAFWCDPSRPDIIREMRIARLPARAASNEVVPGIATLHQAFAEKRLFVARGVVNTIRELINYSYREKGGEYVDAVVKEDDHTVDALRYAVHSSERKRGFASSRKPAGW